MAELTPADHVALELCPQHVDCAGCQHRADITSRLIDERLAAAYAPVHELMRGWAGVTQMTAFSPQQATARSAVGHALEELRKVVGHEGDAP